MEKYNKLNITEINDKEIINLDFIGNIENIKTHTELFFIKGNFDAHIKCFNGYYKDNILNNLGAVIELPDSHEDYLKLIGCKSRNMICKAKKKQYYINKIYNYNNYIDDIFKINTSKKIRQNKPMSTSYNIKITEQSDYISDNKYHNLFRYGCFLENKLVAYCFPYISNNCILINSILGHGDYLTYGIMNLLISEICKDMILNYKNIKFFLYIDWNSGEDSLRLFKKSLGFNPKLINLVDIYKINLVKELNYWIPVSSIKISNTKIEVLDTFLTTPGISYSCHILPNNKYIYKLDYKSYNNSRILLYGEDCDTKQKLFCKELIKDNNIIFETPSNCNKIKLEILFRNPKLDDFIEINSIKLYFSK